MTHAENGDLWPDGDVPSSARPAGRPVPGHDALLALIQASLRNAGDLLEEARLLVGNGHSARAHALGTLAFEEMGKLSCASWRWCLVRSRSSG
jgi:hypothetical protein